MPPASNVLTDEEFVGGDAQPEAPAAPGVEGAPKPTLSESDFVGRPAPKMPTASSGLKQFMYGINDFVPEVAKAGEDIAAGNVSFAGYKNPWAGTPSRAVSDYLARNLTPTEPEGYGQRIMRSAGRYVPETLGALAGGAGMVPAAGRAIAGGAEGTAGALAHVIASQKADSIGALASQAASGAVSGAGAEIGKETLPEGYGEAVGSMAPMMPAAAANAYLYGTITGNAARKASGYVAPYVQRLVNRGKQFAADHIPDSWAENSPALGDFKANTELDSRARAISSVSSDFTGLNDPEMQAKLADAQELTARINAKHGTGPQIAGPRPNVTIAGDFADRGPPHPMMDYSGSYDANELPPSTKPDRTKDFAPTLGQATDLPSAVATQRDIEAGASGPDLDQLARERAASYGAVQRYLDANGATPPAGVSAAEAAAVPGQAAGRIVNRTRDALNGEMAQVGEQEQAAIAQHLPETSPYAQGQTLRDRFNTLKTAASQKMSSMFDSLIPEQAQTVPFEKLQDRVKALTPSQFADTSDLGPSTQKILSWKAGEGPPPTVGDVKFLRESLGDEQRTAAQSGNRALAKRIGDTVDQVNQFLDKDWAPTVGGDFADRWQDARKIYKSDYIEPFQTGAARAQQRTGPDNAYRTPNEDVASEYWNAGGTTDAKQFTKTFGDDPVAKKALYAVALDDLRQKAAPNGVWKQSAYDRWVTQNRDNLAEFPELQQKVSNAGDAIDALSARRAELKGRLADVNSSTLAKTWERDPDKIAQVALSNPSSAKTLAAEMTPEEKEQVGWHAWSSVVQGANEDPTKMAGLLDRNREALKVWLKPEQMAALDDATKAWEMLGRTPDIKGRRSDPNELAKLGTAVGTQPLQALSRVFAAASGRTSERYVMSDFLMRALVADNARDAGKLSRQAIYDPEFAKELATYVRLAPQGQSPMPKALRAYISATLARPTLGAPMSASQGQNEMQPTQEQIP